MPYRLTALVNDGIYHVYNRGVEKRLIFIIDRDYQRFLETLYYYQFQGPKPRFSTHQRFKIKDYSNNPKIISVMAYCLMPTHFHLILKQLKDNGITEFIGKVCNSYTKYFNTKHGRIGPLLQGEFKTVLVESNEQLLQLSRYIHLNPYMSEVTNDLRSYPYSSYQSFIGNMLDKLSDPELVLSLFKSKRDYQGFVLDQADYAREVKQIEHLLLDPDS